MLLLWFDSFKKHWVYFLVFFAGFGLRFIPELFSMVYPAGCDIPFYIFEMKLIEDGFSFSHLYFGQPLMYGLLLTLRSLVGVDWFVFFKVFTPFLNGCVAVCFLYFLRNSFDFKWSNFEYVLCVLLMVFSSSGVIMSNGIIKQQLGLCFFFLFFVFYKRSNFRKELLFVLLIALTHQIISLMVVGLIFLDFVYEYWKQREVLWNNLLLIVCVCVCVFVFIFVLPPLGSEDYVCEFVNHFGSYLNQASYGIRYNNIPIAQRIYEHFIWYYGFWLAFVFIAFSQFRNRFISLWLLFLTPLSFIPLGTIWARFQWLLIYPFSILVVGGLKWCKHIRTLFLVFVIFNGLIIVVEPTWSMSRSSMPFDEVDDLKQCYNSVSALVDGNSLIITSSVSLSWVNLFLHNEGKSAHVISERTISLYDYEESLWMYRDGIKGHDFYIFRVTIFNVCLDDYDSVLVFDDGYFTHKNVFDGSWHFFQNFYKLNNITVYTYGVISNENYVG